MKEFIHLFTLFVTVTLSACSLPQVSIATYAGDRKAAVSLTFDDGLQEHFTLVAPYLDRYGLKGTFGINGKFIGDRADSYAPRLTWDECRQMARNGHEINNHTWSHPNLYSADSVTIVREIAMNDSVLIAELGEASRSVLYPFNGYNDTVLRLCEQGKVGSRRYQFALGQRDSGCTRQSLDRYLHNLIEKGEWGITMTHGIHTAWDQWEEPQILWDFFQTLSEKSDTVWTDTFAAVQAYIKERDASRLSTHLNGNVLTIDIACPLDARLFNQPLTLKIEGLNVADTATAMQVSKPLPATVRNDCLLIEASPYDGPITIQFNRTK
ncbi:MAG: polysaccharide deacetylase family protein [Prevotellaceae bacterium]|jgi:peptidoglycan/xylan/chitin deacetylase (PgdA/CDA1 family)|nr:polysaccharide deacetylase family protein [Prevotellaceae bacterium]